MQTSGTLLLVLLPLVSALLPVTTVAADRTYISGASADWNLPANWSPLGVPGADDTALIGGFLVASLDNAGTPGARHLLGGLDMTGDGTFNFTGSHITLSRELKMAEMPYLNLFNTSFSVPTAALGPGYGCGGILLNPSHLHVTGTATLADLDFIFGLGGTAPASLSDVGAGHYATWVADTLVLEGDLFVELNHGFMPSVGQAFQILTATSSTTGTFANAPEGALVGSFGDVGLRVSYLGGDGNDVVLHAVAVPEPGMVACGAIVAALGLARSIGRGRR